MRRSRKRLDRTGGKREQWIRNDQSVIDSDRIPKALAGRACAKGRVKAEQRWLGLLVPRAVVFTDVAVGEFEFRPFGRGDDRTMPFAKTDLQRIDEPSPDRSFSFQTVNEYER